jgi:GNAT superfamily N-acetyltransferase
VRAVRAFPAVTGVIVVRERPVGGGPKRLENRGETGEGIAAARCGRRFAPKRLKEFEVTVAEDETGIVAFLARRGEEVRLLYTRPDRIGMGAGSQLIDAAKATGIGALELWCFQANERARRFYEARGFHAIRFTDGADNEEQMPDIRYRWERPTVVTDLPSSPLSGLFQRPSRT